MPRNRFASHAIGPNGPALASFPITPSNTADLPETIRAITIGAAGVIAWRAPDGTDQITAELPAGTYAIAAIRVRATGTTAQKLTGWV